MALCPPRYEKMKIQEIFQLLISVGKVIEDGSELPNLLINSLKPHSQINLLPHEKAISEINSFTNKELILLLKGLTYVEGKLEWPGGSVAVSKPIFDVLCTREIGVEQVNELSDWIIDNSGNFFNQVRRVHESNLRGYYDSDSEYKKAIKRKNEASACAQRKQEEQRKRSRKEADDQRGKREASRFASHQHRNTPDRAELVSQINDMPVHDQLATIAEDDVHAPNFYPTKCASSASVEIIESLPSNIKEKLVLKLKGRQRGPWGGFKKRLLSVFKPGNDHR